LDANRVQAIRELQALAKAGGTGARAARYALASLGEPSVKPALVADLRGADAALSLRAAQALIDLGDSAQASEALAARSAAQRAQVACAILAHDGS
jgi:hypothetical protein